MIHLAHLQQRLSTVTIGFEDITMKDLDYYIRLVSHFKTEIMLHTPHTSAEPPFRLPLYLHTLFQRCLGYEDDTMVQLWESLKHEIWSGGSAATYLTPSEMQIVDKYGKLSNRPREQLGEW